MLVDILKEVIIQLSLILDTRGERMFQLNQGEKVENNKERQMVRENLRFIRIKLKSTILLENLSRVCLRISTPSNNNLNLTMVVLVQNAKRK